MPYNLDSRREQGLCLRCPNPVEVGFSQCETHRAYARVQNKKQRTKRVKEGRCWCCGRPRLKEGMAVYKYHCPSCAEKIGQAHVLNRGH